MFCSSHFSCFECNSDNRDTQPKSHNLFRAVENSIEQCFAQPRSQGLCGETVTKTLVKFVLSFQNIGEKIACAVRHNRIAIQFEYGCVSLRMRFFSQNFGTIKRILPGLRHRLTAKALGPRLCFATNIVQ